MLDAALDLVPLVQQPSDEWLAFQRLIGSEGLFDLLQGKTKSLRLQHHCEPYRSFFIVSPITAGMASRSPNESLGLQISDFRGRNTKTIGKVTDPHSRLRWSL